MQLIEVPAKTGYVWFRQGIWLFRKNPLALLALFFAYLLVITLILQVPLIGAALRFALVPGVTVGFMAACRDTIAGKPVFPTLLVDGFRSYGNIAARRLVLLGVLYIVAMTTVLAVSTFADGGVLLHLILGTGNLDEKAILNSNLPFAALIALAIYVPVAMPFWFSPILCAWHDVSPMKAMFFSIVSCWRNRGAFIVYGALWFAVATTGWIGLTYLMLALDVPEYAPAVLLPALVVLMTMIYCSIYATYRGCFGVPPAADAPDLPAAPPA